MPRTTEGKRQRAAVGEMINSTSNRQVKAVIQLQKKAKARREQRVFVVEGMKMFREAPKDRLVQVYVSESFLKKEKIELTEYEVVADHVFAAMSDTQTPQGILCVVRQKEYLLEEMFQVSNPRFLILENLQDPGNLGTIFRTAEGAGMDGILMSRDTVDIYNPKTVRSTMGSLYRLPFLYAGDLQELVKELKTHGVKIFAAHLRGTKNYYEENYREGCAFLIGNEGNGLTDALAELADCYIKIPMEGQLESLNAAVAAAVLMYETKRQRS